VIELMEAKLDIWLFFISVLGGLVVEKDKCLGVWPRHKYYYCFNVLKGGL